MVDGLESLRGYRSGRRRLGVTAGEHQCQAQVGVTERAGQDLTVLVRHRRAQFQVGDRLAELTLQGAQDAAGHQQPGPFRRRPGEPEQDLGQPVLPLPQQAGDLPVSAQVGSQPDRFRGTAGPVEGVAEGGAQVGMLAPEQVVALELVVVLGVTAEFTRHGAEVRDVLVLRGVRVGGQPGQPFGPELADGVQQPVPRGVLLRAQHHRLVHQGDEGGQDVLAGQGAAGAERLGGGEVERSGDTDSRAQSSCSSAEQRA
ncbi:MAG TPA: hypothetical protein VHS30_22375 [Streptosporangiaceae bacterium]|nr:hypothetical protein [Streptosporangiaceae bacterium]